jgi:hypothetical protein
MSNFRSMLALVALLASSAAIAAPPPPIPPLADADRIETFNITSSTPLIQVGFPVFGDCTDIAVQVNGVTLPLLPGGLWNCASESGMQISLLPLPITDMVVNFTPALTTGALTISGSWHPRDLVQPTAPGINRREFNQTVSTLIASNRELFQDINGILSGTVALGNGIVLPGVIGQIATYTGPGNTVGPAANALVPGTLGVGGGASLNSITMTAEPNQIFSWAGAPTAAGDLRQLPGSLATTPEIGQVSIINAMAGGGNPTAFFKMNQGYVCTTEPGSASCWNINPVIDLQFASGLVGGVGVEADVINLNHDYLSPSDNPLAVAYYATGAPTNQFYSDAAFIVTGSGPTWTDGIQGSQFSHAAATVTFTLASPGIVNQTAHGYIAGQAVVFTTTGALPTGLTAGLRFYVVAAGLGTNAFEVSATPGGAAVAFTGSQSGVQTSAGANVFMRSFINDTSNSPVSFLISGTHDILFNGAGATCVQFCIVTPNFTVDGQGDVAGFVITAHNSFALNNPLFNANTPSVASGFGTGGAVAPNNNGTATFRIIIGTGGTASGGIVTMPQVTNGWSCQATDITTNSVTVFATKQLGPGTPTSVTLGNLNTSGAAAAWVAGDVLVVNCDAY